MKKTFQYLIFFSFFISTGSLNAAYLILNNNNIIKGKIDYQNQSSVIFIKEGTDEKLTIPITEIHKILNKPLYLEKTTVHKTNTATFEAYCVDYDQTSYTFRKELNDPDEQKIMAEDILYFETKLLPLNQTFELSAGSVKLKWLSPDPDVKSYKIYYKTKIEINYKLSGETDKSEYVLQGLSGSTEYQVLVRSIISDGFESFPGKPVSLTTANEPPDKPSNVSARKSSGDYEINLTWDQSQDKDGSVKGYSVYKKNRNEYEKIGTTDKTEYSYSIKNPLSTFTFQVKAFDNIELESAGAETESFSFQYKELKAGTGYLLPSGNLADIFNSGLCGIISLSINNYFINGLSLGGETGFYTLYNGKNFESFKYQSFNIIPFYLNAGYRFVITDNLYLEPSIGMGYCYAVLEYKDAASSAVSSTEITPAVKAGVSASYIISGIDISLGTYYSSIIESDIHLNFIMINLSAGYMF